MNRLSTDKKSGDYNPFYNGVDNNIFPNPLTDFEMKEMGFTRGEYKNDGNGYYAWVYYRDISSCCRIGCKEIKFNKDEHTK